jgi:hypothetical protein
MSRIIAFPMLFLVGAVTGYLLGRYRGHGTRR